MTDSQSSMKFEKLNSLKNDQIKFALKETMTKLKIFQRGLRLNVSVTMPANRALAMKKTTAGRKDKSLSNITDEKLLNAIKFDNELDTLLMVFETAVEELDGKGTRNEKTLEQIIATLQDSDSEVETQAQELRRRQVAVQSLKSQIETEHIEAVKRMQSMDEKIATLRHNLRNIRCQNDLEFRLVERWEANRYTQASIICTNEERALQLEIEDLDRKLNEETRTIAEVEKFNSKQFDEFRVKIAEWKTKYANEMAKITAETTEQEERITELAKIRERHEQTYAERVTFVREYLTQKAEEERLHELQMHRVTSAVKIQAWWRGIMVRHGLGPYKKKAKKGKKGKGKGK